MSTETISLTCSKCSKKLNVPVSMAGRYGECPACKSRIAIPVATTWQSAEKVLPRRKSDEELLATSLAKIPDPNERPAEAPAKRESLVSYDFLAFISSLYFVFAGLAVLLVIGVTASAFLSSRPNIEQIIAVIAGGSIVALSLAAAGEMLSLTINVATGIQRQAIIAGETRDLLRELVEESAQRKGG